MSDHTQSGPATLEIVRHARVFTEHPERVRDIEAAATVHRLLEGQQLTPETSGDLVVRQGNMRVSERLPDGREVTRAVLQTGTMCRMRPGSPADSDTDGSPLYSLEATTLEALGETEIWTLPPGIADAT